MTDDEDSTEPPLLAVFRRLIDDRDHWAEQTQIHLSRAASHRRCGNDEAVRAELSRAQHCRNEVQRIDQAVFERTFSKARGARIVTLAEWAAISAGERLPARSGKRPEDPDAEAKSEALDAIRDWIAGEDTAQAVLDCARHLLGIRRPELPWIYLEAELVSRASALVRRQRTGDHNSNHRRDALLRTLLHLIEEEIQKTTTSDVSSPD